MLPRPMAKDYYATLGLERNASADDVKKAYRKLSKELHPDRNPGNADAEKKFKEVNQAYEVLSNPQKKQAYDQFGEAGVNGGAGGFGGGGGGGGFGGFDFSGFQNGGQGFDVSDLFENFFRGGGGGPSQRSERGQDRELTIEIDFANVVLGTRKTIRIRRLRACSKCSGNGAEPGSAIVTCKECSGTGQVTREARSFFGMVQQRILCPTCNGSGKIPEKPCTQCKGEGRMAQDADVTIDVPAGIDDGQTLRLRGEGDAGRRGAEAGDLYVHIRVRPDPRFEREGADIRSVLTIPVVDAILGTSVNVDTVHGPVEVKIPDGTQPAHILRLKGKGLPVLNSSRMGDHYLTINIEIPKKLSRAERKVVEEWKEML